MNAFSMLGDLGWWEGIVTIVDAIPKLVYLLYTCVASAVDAMQLLVRRICGLDLYFNNQGQVIRDQDPLTEFINGILGIGDTAGAMQALNTTFWSLTIFALILLSLTSIVAIIKSHYNEDVGKTSPAKILYGAFKSILTFFIVPAAVVIGLQLSGLLLRTLDDITAGTADAETVSGIYGSNNLTKFKPYVSNYDDDGFSSYSGYDMFGWGQPATNSPISGQLFKAAAYNCNRFRAEGYTLDNINGDGPSMSMGGLFGQGPSYEAAADKLEYVAYQVDYAFINNLQLSSSYDYNTLKANANDTENGARIRHLEFAFDRSLDSFSKYDIAFVWVYYDLWNFNFIVGFAGAVSAFGIMISIIIGLMMRLIKSAAMFLIYPPLLGLAPMDDFKAFKSWSNEFIKQILSAFGAIVGLNLLFLILPYVQQVSFFNHSLLDAIVNCVFLITGLIMAKDFISMVAGFVGGGDVFSTGDGAKGQVAKTMASGVKKAVGAGAAVTAVGLAPAMLATRIGLRQHAKKRIKAQNEASEAVTNYNTKLAETENKWNSGAWQKDDEYFKRKRAADSGLDLLYHSEYHRLKAAHPGYSKDKLNQMANTVVQNELYSRGVDLKQDYTDTMTGAEKTTMENAVANARGKTRTNIQDWAYKKSTTGKTKASRWLGGKLSKGRSADLADMASEEGRKSLSEDLLGVAHKRAERNYLNDDGSSDGKARRAMLGNWAAQSLSPSKIFAKDVSASLNVDKLAGQFKTLSLQVLGKDEHGNDAIKSKHFDPSAYKEQESARGKFENEATKLGYSKGSDEFKKYIDGRMADYNRQLAQNAGKEMARVFRDSFGSIFSGSNRGSGAPNIAGEKLQKAQLKATEAQTEATKKQGEKIDKLIQTMESFIKSSGGGSGTS